MKRLLHNSTKNTFPFIQPIIKTLFVVCFFLVGMSMMGQTSIWTNPIIGTDPGILNPYTTGDVKNTNITVSGIGRGTSLSADTSTDSYDTSGWTTATTIDLNGYFNFTITPGNGYKVSMNNFVYVGTGGAKPPTSFAFRSNANANNFTSDIGTPSATGTTINLSTTVYQDLSASTTFRLYGWNRANGSDGTWAINDFTFNGTVLGSGTTALGFGSNAYGSAPVQTFQVNGAGLNPTNATITINGSANYEVSTTSSTAGFGATATLTASGGNLSSANVWVRLKATSAVGTYNENITFDGGGVTGITIPCTGTVTTAPLTITGLTANNKIYDGLTTATLSGTAAYSGLQNSESFAVTGTPSASFATASVGNTKAVTVSGYTAPSSNYTITQPSLTANITPAPLTITGISVNNKTYNGLTAATLSGTATYVGLQNSENFAVTGSPSASFDTAAVGIGKAVTVTGYTAPSSNYTVSQPTGLTADISTAPLNITANNGSKTYGQTFTTGSGSTLFTSTGLQNGETIGSITIASSGDVNTAVVNTYPIVPTSATGGTFTTSNYTITYTDGTLTVNPAPLTITSISADNKSYDGLTTATISGTATYSGLQNGESFSVSGTPIASFATASVGNTKAVTVSGYTAPSSNYTITQPSLTADITPVNLTITGITADDKTYDGTTLASLSGTATYVGLQNGESFTVTGTPSANFATAAAGIGKAVTVTGYTAPSSNYTVSQPTGLTATISAANPTSATASVSTICSGGNTILTLNGGGGETAAVVNWYAASCGGTFVGTGNGLSVSPSVTTTYFGRYEGVFTTNCASVTITVNPLSTVGSVSTDQTICTGNSPSNDITISSATGTIQWQRADNSGFTIGLINIGSNATTLTIAEVGTLTATKYFKAIVTSGVCSAVTSGTVIVSVDSNPTVGSVSANQTICSGGSPSSNITIASATGIIQWQKADDAGFISNVITVGTNSTTLTIAEIGTLTATKYFRAIVSNGVCPVATSGTVVVTVNNLPAGPVIAKNPNDIEVCAGTLLTITVTTAGTGGAVSSQDEYRFTTDNGSNWSSWSSTIPNFAAVIGTNIVESRRTSTGSGCTTAAGNSVSWTVNAVPVGPIITKSPNVTAICEGESLTIAVTTAGTGGAISSQDEYRFSTENGSNWSSWSSTIPNFVAVSGINIIESRRTSTGIGCTTATGNTVSWTVNAVPIAPTITKNPNVTSVCSGATLSITIASAGTGGALSSQDEYRFSTDNGSNWSSWSTTIPSFAAVIGTNIVESRRISTGLGCTTAAGNSVSWTVNAVPVGPVITKSPNQTAVCVGATLTIAVTTAGTGGAISSQDEYRFSTDNGSNWSSWSSTIPNFTAVTGINIVESRRTSTGIGCTTANGNTVSWTVNSLPVAPSITKNPNVTSVCAGAALSITIASAGTGGALSAQDEYRYNAGSGYTAWSTTIPNFSAGIGTNIIESRRTSTGSGCTTSSTNTVSWTVNPDPSPGSLTKSPNTTAVCDGTVVSVTAGAGAGGAGTIVDELEVSLSGGGYVTYTSGATINTTGQTSVSVRTRRIADGSGCATSSYNTVSWTVNPLPTANAGFDSTIFRGNPTTTPLGATAVGSNTYSWVSNPIGFTSSISNPTVSPLVNTTYTLTETTPAGCVKSNSVTVTVRDNLVVSKSRIGAAPTKPGDVVTYQISYQNLNNGGVSAENITITDILPSTSYFTYTSSTPTGTYSSGTNSLTYTLASLAAGASGSITVSGTVGVLGGYGYNSSSYYISSGSSTQTITNSASIVNPVTPALVSNVSDTVTQNCGVSMPATLSGQVHTSTGSNVYYFIEVENTGNSTDRFSLSNTIPAQTGDVPLTSLITNMAGDTITQTPWLTPGQKYGFLVQFTTPLGTPPDKWNYTSIRATSTVCTTFASTYIDTYVYNGPQPTGCDLLISKTASASSVVAGANITYNIVVRNLRNNKAKDLVIDDILPANLNYISATQTGADNINYNSTTRLIRVTRAGNYDNADPDIVITITAQTTCASVPTVLNSASVDNKNADDNILNNESSVTVTVLPNVSDPLPTSAIICSGNSTTISMPVAGANRNYKWYSAATGGTLLQTNGNTYTTGTLTSSTTFYVSQYNTLDSACESNRTAIPITVVSAPVVVAQPADITVCSTTASFTYNVNGTFLSQQWQVSTDGGTNWNNLSNSGVYSGTTTQTLNISNLAGLWGYQYRCNLNSFSCYALTSDVATVVSLPTITGTLSVCSGSTTTLTGSGIPDPTNPWASSNQAVATVNSSGVVTGVSAGTSVITYKSSNNCTITATVTVNALPNNISNGFSATTICFGGTPLLTFDAENSSFSTPYSVTYRNDITLTQYTATIPNASAYNFTAGDNPTSNSGYTILSISNAFCTRTSGFMDSGANLSVRPLPIATISGTTSVCSGSPSPNIVFANPQTVDITVTYTINGVSQTINVGNNSSSSVAASTTVSGSFVYNLVSVAYQSNPNCSNTISGSATVTINPLPSSPSLVTTQPNCALQTGTITINSVAGETYSFDGGSYSGTLVYSSLAQGSTHTVSSMNTFGCISATSSTVTIIPLVTNTWTTTGWSSGIPDLNTLVIIDANYNTSTHGDLNACSVTVNLGKTLTITPDDYATIQNDLTVNGRVDVLDKGSLVMINDAGTVTNNGTTTVRRFTSPFEKFDYVYWSTPVESTFIPSTFLNWRTNYAFEFLPANFIDANNDSFDDDGNDWSYASTMTPGKGFIVMTPTNKAMYPSVEEIVFSGKVNNGVITTPIALTPSITDPGDDFNLVGNPYPSAIDADAFINANISTNVTPYNTIDGTLYFWTHIGDISNTNGGPDGLNFSTNDYALYTLAGGVQAGFGGTIPSGFIASGQGFFVEADNAGNLLFNNAMRVGTETKNNQFYKLQSNYKKSTNISKDRLWLNLENSSKMFSQQLIGYFDNATLGYDKGYDGLFSDAGNYINFYSFIDSDTYKIQGRSSFDENDQVRLGYSSTIAGTFTIAIDTKEGVFTNTNQAVYIEDKVTNTIFNLKNGSYNFTTEKGTFNDRFILRYTDKTLGLNEVNKEDGILVFYSKNNKMLTIKNEWSNSTIRSIALYSISGQNISNWDVENRGQNIIQIPIKNNSTGIYIVKVKTSEGEISKKISID